MAKYVSKSPKVHSSPLKLKCTQCIYKTKHRSDLRRHTKRHSDVKFPCDICNMPFMTLGHLGGHKRSHHSNETDERKATGVFRRFCHTCDYTTLYSSDMARHRHKHEDNAYHCPLCNYPFGHESTLKVHMRKYHGEGHHKPREDIADRLKIMAAQSSEHHTVKGIGNRKDRHTYSRHGDSTNISSVKQHQKDNVFNGYPDNAELTGKPTVDTKDKKATHETMSHCSSLTNASRNYAERSSNHKATHGGRGVNMIPPSKTSNTIDSKRSYNNNIATGNKHNQEKSHSSFDEDKNADSALFRIYSCSCCTFRTCDHNAFRRHSNRHDKGKFKCQFCKKPFLFKTNLDRHLETKHADSDESSDNSSFESPSINSPVILRCKDCEFVTYSYNQMSTHREQHKGADNLITKCVTDDDVKTREDTESITEFSLDDKDPYLQFSFEDITKVDEHSAEMIDCVGDTDELGSDKQEPFQYKIQHLRKDQCIKVRETVCEEDSNSVSGINTTRKDEKEDVGGIEEYCCTICEYATLEESFIRLHMTVHGFEYKKITKKSKSKSSNQENELGFKTRLFTLGENVTLGPLADIKSSTSDPEYMYLNEHVEAKTETFSSSTYTNTIEAAKIFSEPMLVREELKERLQDDCSEIDTSCTTSPSEINLMETNMMISDKYSTSNSGSSASINLTGRLNREEFEQTRMFYKIEQAVDGTCSHVCKICDRDNTFDSKLKLFRHFKTVHDKLRKQICSSCKYCSAPFPKLD